MRLDTSREYRIPQRGDQIERRGATAPELVIVALSYFAGQRVWRVESTVGELYVIPGYTSDTWLEIKGDLQ